MDSIPKKNTIILAGSLLPKNADAIAKGKVKNGSSHHTIPITQVGSFRIGATDSNVGGKKYIITNLRAVTTSIVLANLIKEIG